MCPTCLLLGHSFIRRESKRVAIGIQRILYVGSARYTRWARMLATPFTLHFDLALATLRQKTAEACMIVDQPARVATPRAACCIRANCLLSTSSHESSLLANSSSWKLCSVIFIGVQHGERPWHRGGYLRVSVKETMPESL